MSSLIFYTSPNVAFVAADTLAVSAQDRTPQKLCSKIFYLPHLRLIVAARGGFTSLTTDWIASINNHLFVHDVVSLDSCVQQNLSVLFSQYKNMTLEKYSSGFIHIGYSFEDDRIHGFAYRSELGFSSEALPYGVSSYPNYPECSVPEGKQDFFKVVPGVMKLQQKEQIIKEGITGIGGHIIIMRLDQNGCSTFTIEGSFDD